MDVSIINKFLKFWHQTYNLYDWNLPPQQCLSFYLIFFINLKCLDNLFLLLKCRQKKRI